MKKKNYKVKLKVKELLEERNITQKKLAQISGIRESTISDIVRGTRTVINFEHLSKIAEALEIDNISQLRPIFENKDRSKAKYETGICYSAEIACEGNIWQKDDTKCENIRCKAVPYQIAAGRWEKLQFHSYHSRSAATSLSDGGG